MWNEHLYPRLGSVLAGAGIYRKQDKQYYRLIVSSRYAVWVECEAPSPKSRQKRKAKRS